MRVHHEEDDDYDFTLQRSPDYSTPEGARLSTTLQTPSPALVGTLLSPEGAENTITTPPIYRKLVLTASVDGVVVDKYVFVTRWS